MKTWLHLIGHQYYTPTKFRKEAEMHGVSRRIAPKLLKTFEFGDKVLLAYRKAKSTPVVFGYFIVEKIVGLNKAAWKVLEEKFDTKLTKTGGYAVQRRCGICYIDGEYEIDATIEEIMEALEGVENIGWPMVGGTFYEHDEIRLKSIKRHSRGFRLFDYESFILDAHRSIQETDKGIPKVMGHFYIDKEDCEPDFEDHNQGITVFSGYQRA